MFRKAYFLTQEAFRTIMRYKGVAVISVAIMSLSLLMLAVFLLATENLLKLVGETQSEMEVYVYLDDAVTGDGAQRIYHELLSMKETESVVYVTREEAMVEFRKRMPQEDAELLDALETNPLPNSFWITPRGDSRDQASLASFAGRVSQVAGVEEVRYGKDFVEKFSKIVRIVYYIDIVVGLVVIMSAIFIISNAVRLTIFGRKRNIEILKLVGASNRFLSLPFIIEGALQGGLAALLSLMFLFAITVASRRVIPDLSFFSIDKAAIYIFACIAIGSLGSYAALRRHLRI